MRIARCILISVAVLGMGVGPSRAFSGEDLLHGRPWYHEAITEDAAAEVGLSRGAADTIAWHADYIDSYLYNPLWWVAGGIDRFKVSLATGPELEKLHFDDLFSGDHVRRAWERYLTGTMAGLIWAWRENDVSAARNIVGASLHAVQDFYSHSNWVDEPARRTLTWFEMPAAQRARLNVWTGAYEHPAHLGVKHHGKVAPACSILNQPGVRELMELGTSGPGFLNNTTIGQQFKACQSGVAIRPEVMGVRIPGNVIYVAPPGIALDSRWLADIAVQVRELTGVSGGELFEQTRELAERASVQWLRKIEEKMTQVGAGAFWQQVKTGTDTPREREYERYNRFPYTFLSAGPYPPNPSGPRDEYFLRVRLVTARDSGAGTDADIYLHAAGQRFLLDYMPRANPVLAYNDFEAGDDQVYVVGPFTSVPGSIQLENNAATGGEVFEALGRSFVSAIEGFVSGVGDFLLSLIGGHADIIATQKHIWSPAQLAGVPTGGQPFSVYMDGRDEGRYRVHGTIRKTGDSRTERWREFRVTLDRLECVKESVWDRGSNSDEPFILVAQVPLPGEVTEFRTEPFDDVDTGESRTIGHSFPVVRLPDDYGMLSIPVSVMESDDESRSARNQLLARFAGKARDDTAAARRGFTDALGAAIAADWKLGRIEVYAFGRGNGVRGGTVLETTANRWINGRSRASFTLNTRAVRDYGITAAELQSGPPRLITPPVVIEPPPILRPGGPGLPTPGSP